MTLPATLEISPEELREHAQAHIDWVTHCLADGDHESWTPGLTVNVMDQDGTRAIEIVSLNVPFNTADEKRRALMHVGSMFGGQRKVPLIVAFSSEGWQSRNTPAGMQPKDDPFRSEVILMAAMTCHRLTCLTTAPVQRPNGNIAPVQFAPLQMDGATFPLLDHLYAGFVQAVLHRRRKRAPAPSPN